MIELPIGSIIAWAKSFVGVGDLPDGWVEANGQKIFDNSSPLDGKTLPNLNAFGGGTQYFLRGCTASGATSGADCCCHCHGLSGNTCQATANGTAQPYGSGTAVCIIGTHCHGLNGNTGSCTVATIPSAYHVVWIFRIK